MTGEADLCTFCNKPFSPSHNHRAPGPTAKHPFFPAPLKKAIDEVKREGGDAKVTRFDLEERSGTLEDPDVLYVDISVRVPAWEQIVEFTVTMRPKKEEK